MTISRLAAIPRFPLCTLPTPLQRASKLEQVLGPRSPQIWIKRDDLTGIAFGGNKARKLEYLLGDARAMSSTVLVSEGNTQSNHARMTAAAAVIAGLKCVLVLDTRPGTELQGNYLLDHLFGASIRLVTPGESRSLVAHRLTVDLAESGEHPYLIPTGGSVPLGALGYVNAIVEIAEQLENQGIQPARIYSPTGSQGTLAGLVVGGRALLPDTVIQGIAVEEDSNTLIASAVPIAQGAAHLLGLDEAIGPDWFSVDDRYVGDGYGISTPQCLEAITLLARTEAIVLEPVYSAKAMAGLIDHVRSGHFGPEDSTVFLHTGGGPTVFARAAEIASHLQQ